MEIKAVVKHVTITYQYGVLLLIKQFHSFYTDVKLGL